jgi:DcmR-like sensory protein
MRGATRGHDEGRSHTHLCRVFDDQAEFRVEAVAFLADGLARGSRVRYLAEGDPETLRADIAPLLRLPQAQRPGAVEVGRIADAYADPDSCIDAATQVAVFAAGTRAALADGFTGLRVAADTTPLVGTPAQLDAFARYEYRFDRMMTELPVSGLCGFRRTELGDDVVTQLACLHPSGGAAQAPFRVHAVRGAELAVSGELDLTTVDLFATTMDRVGLPDGPAEVVVDATGLAFADHRNLLVLERLAHRHELSVVLRTGRRWPELLVAALELTRVRVERVA